jgi:N-acetylmuramoyl-L-alanine amidase
MAYIKIAVDAGHGSMTAGKRTAPMRSDIDVNKDGKADIKKGEQYREHIANVGVANLLIKELDRCGFATMISGFDDNDATDDVDTALGDRQRAIAKANCDFSVSVHFNAYGDGKTFNNANGIGIYIHNSNYGQSEKLARAVLNNLIQGTKQINRGISKQSLAMCNCNYLDVKAAILVELAFMTNENEATTMMANEAFWKECAQEICRGICEYSGIKYIPEKKTMYRVQVGAYAIKSNAVLLSKELAKLGYDNDVIEVEL